MGNSHGRFVWYELMTTDMKTAKNRCGAVGRIGALAYGPTDGGWALAHPFTFTTGVRVTPDILPFGPPPEMTAGRAEGH